MSHGRVSALSQHQVSLASFDSALNLGSARNERREPWALTIAYPSASAPAWERSGLRADTRERGADSNTRAGHS